MAGSWCCSSRGLEDHHVGATQGHGTPEIVDGPGRFVDGHRYRRGRSDGGQLLEAGHRLFHQFQPQVEDRVGQPVEMAGCLVGCPPSVCVDAEPGVADGLPDGDQAGHVVVERSAGHLDLDRPMPGGHCGGGRRGDPTGCVAADQGGHGDDAGAAGSQQVVDGPSGRPGGQVQQGTARVTVNSTPSCCSTFPDHAPVVNTTCPA